jgi:5-formyltetrahydrofolate cyclo-ligase
VLPERGAGKPAWRVWARDVHARLDVTDISEISRRIVAHLLAWPALVPESQVLVFLPLAGEVDLRPLPAARPLGRFFATRTPDRGGALTVHQLGGPLEVHRLGFAQPLASAPLVDPATLDVLLVPGLAFDRLLATVSASARVVGVTPAVAVVERLPREPHDVPVGYLATEAGIVEVDR